MSDRLRKVQRLRVTDHTTGAAGMTYVYPVVSRRAGGVSVGVNLHPNHACNWRCLYCQVEELRFGNGPPVDLEVLARELDEMLEALVHGDALERWAPPEARRLVDVAFSGDGEPTTSPHLLEAVDVVLASLERVALLDALKLVLITNGSMMHKPRTQEALRRLAAHRGEVWYKLDSATAEGMARLNGAGESVEHHLEGLRIAARLCPTWVQTCVVRVDGELPSRAEREAYLGALRALRAEGVRLEGVLVYTLARASHHPEHARVEAAPPEALAELVGALEREGLVARAFGSGAA